MTISIEQVLAFALRDRAVLDHLGDALRADLVLANPHYRRVAEFADGFLIERGKLPGSGDWSVWLEELPGGVIRDGTREALGRVLATPVPDADPVFFASHVITHLQQTAVMVARARLNEMPQITPEAFASLAEQVSAVRSSTVDGLTRLSDVDVWANAHREEGLLPTGYAALDRWIGGFGKELWILFADAKAGKSMLLQNFATHAARRGACVLHVTLELGLRAQIQRYYRQLAQAERGEFATDLPGVKDKLLRWFRMAAGDVYLLEFPAYQLDPEQLHRTIARVGRMIGKPVTMLVLDYLDLLSPTKGKGGRSAYEDLGRLTHEVRSLCPAHDLTVLTASQAVRRPEKAGRLTQRDMGDSYGKVRGADGLLSLNQTAEEAEVYQGRMGLLLARDAGGQGMEIPLYINRDLSLIQQLDHPNTYQLMARLGHLPVQLAAVAAGASIPRQAPVATIKVTV